MRDAKFEAEFGDGEYTFRLPWGQIIELQEKTGVGPYALFRRILSNDWQAEDIAETIRLALIGGDPKLTPVSANKLVTRYVRERPLMENVTLARAILQVALLGVPDEPVESATKGETESIESDDGKLKVQTIYGAGTMMGYTPQQVNEMSVWQFAASWAGYVKANSAEDENALSEDEKTMLWELVKEHS